MVAVLIKPTPPSRLSLAFATALTLHLLAALTLPNLKLLLDAATSSSRTRGSAALPLPPPQTTTPSGEVIPIRLPLAGFRMQTELGAIQRSSPQQKNVELPAAAKPAPGKFAMSGRLGAAASEALAADQHAHPKPPPTETMRLVAELRLATGGGPIAGNGGAGEATRAKPVAAPPPAIEKPTTLPKRDIAKAEKAEPPAPARKAQAAPLPPAPAPAPLQQPIRPQIYAPVQTYQGGAPEHIAIAPPLPPRMAADDSYGPPPPATAYPGAQIAPDRGPGEAVGGRGEFFQRLTTHLFQINQIVLAEAIRATPKLTVEVRFTIDRAGRVLGAQVMRTTGDPALDAKVAEVILRASPVPQMSNDMPQARIELSFPVQIYR